MRAIIYVGYELFGRTRGPWAVEVHLPAAPTERRRPTGRQWRLDKNAWVRLPDVIDGKRYEIWHNLMLEVGYDEISPPNPPLPPEMIAAPRGLEGIQ